MQIFERLLETMHSITNFLDILIDFELWYFGK